MKHIFQILTLLIFSAFLFAQEPDESQYMDAYLVVADTSQDYFALRRELFDLSHKCQIPIDTLDRGYDTTKNMICLPENYEDEVYAGEYFPRRAPTVSFSLEYLAYYSDSVIASDKTIALVAAIADSQEAADALLRKIQQYIMHAFILRTKIYMGCMH